MGRSRWAFSLQLDANFGRNFAIHKPHNTNELLYSNFLAFSNYYCDSLIAAAALRFLILKLALLLQQLPLSTHLQRFFDIIFGTFFFFSELLPFNI